MTQSEIFTLAIVAFFVLLILSIVFASRNKKLMNQAKENTKKQNE
jgi:cbb3-type cytochrome oxidase subunit 3